jgi:hypothetical protein
MAADPPGPPPALLQLPDAVVVRVCRELLARHPAAARAARAACRALRSAVDYEVGAPTAHPPCGMGAASAW